MINQHPTQEILKLEASKRFSFACWIETDQHRLILSQIKSDLIDRSAELWIFGPEGVGKTHLALHLAEQFSFHYFDCGEVTPELSGNLFENLLETDGLVLDRADQWLGHDIPEAALFSWWKRKQNGLILISRSSPRVDKLISLPDLASRSRAALILPLDGLGDEGCHQLFKCHLKRLHIHLTPDVIRFLTPRLPRNPSKLMNLISAIDEESLRDQRKVTIPWLSQLLNRLS